MVRSLSLFCWQLSFASILPKSENITLSMKAENKDLETLRTEHQQLGSRITRLSIILISILTVVTFTITNALKKVDVSNLKQELDNAKQAREIASNYYFDADIKTQSNEEIEKLRDLYLKANGKENELQDKYDTFLEESFSINPSIFGSGLRIDLRSWIYSIPFIVLIAGIYIQILRKKQKTLSLIAASQLSNTTEPTKIDRLIFSERPGIETPYARNPSQLEQTIYLLIIVFLLSLIIVALNDADVVLLGLGLIETFQYLFMFLTVSFYGVSYYYYVSTSLDEQATAITGHSTKPSFPIRTWRKLQALTRRLTSRLRPKISLATGSLLILASLFLSTAASCDKAADVVRLPGYKLLQESGGQLRELERLITSLKGPGVPKPEDKFWQDSEGGWWVSVVMNTKTFTEGLFYWNNSINNLGRHAYALSLVLAVLTLLVVLCLVRRYKLYGIKKVHAFLFLFSMTLSLIVITDFAFSAFWFKDELFLLSNLFWIVPAAFLCRITLSNRVKTRTLRTRIKPFLVILLLPLVVSATVYVCYVAIYGFIGVIVYFIGINLLSLTYLEIWRTEGRKKKTVQDITISEAASASSG